jgi:HTH-type transcriptional repressor of NAD biosynthesis genes
MDRTKRGVIIGRFNPPHNGHRYLIDFASSFVDELYIFVCTLQKDEIPGALRFEWMKELYPGARCVHITEENPAANRDQPSAHVIWADAIRGRLAGTPIDYLFASEEYGWKLASELGAEFVPVDPNRDQLPVSGTDIRTAPLKYWNYLPEAVRPYFIKRVGIFAGGDSEVLSRRLASHFRTLYAPHYREYYREVKKRHNQHHTIHESAEKTIAHAQRAMERALSRQAYRLLFLSCHAGRDALDREAMERDLDHLIIVESLVDQEEKAYISDHIATSEALRERASFFHWSENLIGNIETDLRKIFGIEKSNTTVRNW